MSDDTSDRGAHDGRFQRGNTAARGNRGGTGAPPSRLRRLRERTGPRVWRELRAVAFDSKHPWHSTNGFEALRVLASFCFPKPQAVAVALETARGTPTTWAELARAVLEEDGDQAEPVEGTRH